MANPSESTPVPIPESATSRLELVLGGAGLERMQHARVVVLGCGGVGSNCIEALVRGGVGALAVVDGDAVEASNINRQAIAFTTTVGMRKVEAVRAFAHAINPAAAIHAYDRFVLPEDVDELLATIADDMGPLDFVVDAIDTVSTKLAIAAWAERTGIPLVSSMGGAGKLDPAALRISDIADTSHDALARVMRKECRRRGIRHLTVLSSTEEPHALPLTGSTPPDKATAETTGRRPLGTMSYLPPIMGQMIAGHVIRMLALGGAADGK